MRIPIHNVKVGDKLISDVFNDYGLHVLSRDTQLNESDIVKLNRHKIAHVDIDYREIIEVAVSRNFRLEAIEQEIQPKFNDAVNGMKTLFEQVMQEGKINEELVDRNFEPLIEHFEQEVDVVSLLLSLTSKDAYTYQHCVQVGMISYYIAKWVGMNEEEALLTGKAGYLHDIGKCRIDTTILNKPAKLTAEEFNIMKSHTTHGHDIITRSLPNHPALSTVALQHHERLNGNGYPHGITGEQMHPMSKIVAIADIYSAMISSRVYQKKRDLLFVLRELHKLSFTDLDPHIVLTFIQHMIPNFIGKKLILKSGEIGQIIMTNPTDPFRPLIRIDNTFIDLSKDHTLEIETIFQN